MNIDHFDLPLTVTCRISGLQKTYTSREYVEKCLARYNGSLKAFLDDYTCRDAKRMLNDGKSVDEIKRVLCTPDAHYVRDKEEIKQRKAQIRINDKPIEPEQQKPVEKPVVSYPPGYFTSTIVGSIDWKDATKDTCFYPPTYQDGDCTVCKLFSVCSLPTKRIPKSKKF
jgi:hypothetical protein